MQEERRPLFVTQKELDLIARTSIFDFLPSWESLNPDDWIESDLEIPDCHDDSELSECRGEYSGRDLNPKCYSCKCFLGFGWL